MLRPCVKPATSSNSKRRLRTDLASRLFITTQGQPCKNSSRCRHHHLEICRSCNLDAQDIIWESAATANLDVGNIIGRYAMSNCTPVTPQVVVTSGTKQLDKRGKVHTALNSAHQGDSCATSLSSPCSSTNLGNPCLSTDLDNPCSSADLGNRTVQPSHHIDQSWTNARRRRHTQSIGLRQFGNSLPFTTLGL
eukprot:3248656-Amphidinium_carterae.3